VSLIVILGLSRGQKLLDLFISGIALAVAVVPEALPAVVTISLAIGVQRMAKRHALVRRLASVETLGSTSHICTDKTGTLTKDAMTVRKILAGETVFEVTGVGYEPGGAFAVGGAHAEPGPQLTELLKAAVLASDARLVNHEGRWDIKGDPTEGALIVAAAKASIAKAELDARFSDLYRAHLKDVYSYSYYRVGNHHVAGVARHVRNPHIHIVARTQVRRLGHQRQPSPAVHLLIDGRLEIGVIGLNRERRAVGAVASRRIHDIDAVIPRHRDGRPIGRRRTSP
jgi:hypothetical protein